MISKIKTVRLTRIGVAVGILGVVAAGCGKSSSPDQVIDDQLKAIGASRQDVAPFAGTVTIDGQAPKLGKGQALCVILYDPSNPPKPPQHTPKMAKCDKDGKFEFTSYKKGDGAPKGTYVVLFSILHWAGRKTPGYIPPDELHNLYNDPDKSPFKIDLKAGGEKDKQFDLEVSGKQPITAPGPNAVIQVMM